MMHTDVENLLSLLSPHVDAFGVCAIGQNHAMRVGPIDQVVIHFVLSGEGSLQWGDERRSLLPGSIVVVPRNFSKIIAGPGVTRTLEDPTGTCILADGMIKYEAGEPNDHQLSLCCAKISEGVGSGTGLLDCLYEPLVEPPSPQLTWAFEGIINELSKPMIGSKAIIESFMKQIIVLTLRNAITGDGMRSRLVPSVMDPQLSPVINAIISKPAERHSAETLARLSGMSQAMLAHRFRQAFGKSPSEYVRHVRLRASVPMLLNTNLPVKTIAGAVGFSSRSHFSRAFSEFHGLDPSSYRLAANSTRMQ